MCSDVIPEMACMMMMHERTVGICVASHTVNEHVLFQVWLD